MSASIQPTRRPDLDNEADGLDCFASEGAAVVDVANDTSAFVEEARPPFRIDAALRDFWQRAVDGHFALKSAILVVILMMVMTAVEILKEPARPIGNAADARSTPAPAVPPVAGTAQPAV